MIIAGFIKTSLIEWPGKIASVIFVPGCNFKCPFCHNADLVDDKVERFTRIDEGRIYTDLENRKDWVEVVVVTGGEPTLQKDLPKFLKLLKEFKLLTMVHTNGTNPELIEELIKNRLVDYWAMDLKGNFEDYDKYTGIQKSKVKGQKDKSKIKSSMELIVGSGVEFEFRTTVVPGLHDIKNLTKLAEEIQNVLANFSSRQDRRGLKPAKTVQPKWFLQQFRPLNCLDKKYLKIKPYSMEELLKFQQELRKIIPQTCLRGV